MIVQKMTEATKEKIYSLKTNQCTSEEFQSKFQKNKAWKKLFPLCEKPLLK
jgi:hypothetical protein